MNKQTKKLPISEHLNCIVKENNGNYSICGEINENKIIYLAKTILEQRIKHEIDLSKSEKTKDYLITQIYNIKDEIFGVLLLNSQNRLIKFEKLFYGTIDAATIHPRVLVRTALQHNAASIIIAHNHPGGSLSASLADKHITDKIKTIMELIDIKLLDHILIAGGSAISFAENGLL